MSGSFNAEKYTQTQSSNVVFSDFLTNLDVHPGKNDLALHKNENAVKTAIKNLILTNKYERPYQPNLGGNIRHLLFEQMSPGSEQSIKDQIISTVGNYEPRAQIIDVVVTPYTSQDAYVISITFYVENAAQPTTLDVILNRVR